TRAFRYAPPAGIAGNIYHGRESPAYTIGACFDGGNARAFLNSLHIPGAGQTERYGKSGFISMNYIHTKEQRNFQAALLYGNTLHVFYLGDRLNIEKSAHLSFFYFLCNAGTGRLAGGNVAGAGQV